MTFFNGFQPENIIKIIIRNIGFQPLIAVSRKIGVYLYDSDILDIQSRLKESVIDVEYSYIEKIIEHLVAENNTEQ